MRARKTGDPKKETAAARRRRLKNSKKSADEVMAKRAPQPSTRTTNKMSSEAKRTASVIKEGKKRTEKQKYRSEKTFRKDSIRNISDSRAARLKNRFDKNVAKEDRVKGEASRGFDDTRGTKKGSVSKSRGKFVDTTKGAATLSKSRGRKVVKVVSRDKAMKLKKKYNKFEEGGKVSKSKPNPNEKVSYKGKIMKRSQMEAMWAKEDAPKQTITSAEYKKKKAYEDRFDKVNKIGKYKKMASGGRVPKGKYKTSDGREISKSGRREAAIKEIRRKASNKAAKAHKRGQKKGKEIVGYRKGPGDPRMLTQRKLAVYKREKKQRDRGEKKVQTYIDKQAKKYAPKGATGGGRPPKPGRVRSTGDSAKYNTSDFKRRQRCAKRGGRDCRRKQRASGGSAAFR